jgi:DNA repair protein RecN (Recombination protein N)
MHYWSPFWNLKVQFIPFFESNELDYEDDTIVRREILPSGKSRAFINDSPVNLQVLQLSLFWLTYIRNKQENCLMRMFNLI